MSKIAQYLNEHLLGNVTGLASERATYASDGSVLELTPELVVYPKTTNDVRKAARFSWQLAEKGHVLSMTPRGLGSDSTGAALGGGLLIDLDTYLNSVLYISGAKDKTRITHVQPGIRLSTLHEVLRWQGVTIGSYSPDMQDMTVGGAIASGVVSYRAGKYGSIAQAIDRMEVVLANGDLMEVGRIGKREVNKKQGEQTLEGEIYRRIDGLLEENVELISSLSSDNDNNGYRIDKVKQKDGSFDLTPLFVGSQGTLGIISEVVLKTDFYNDSEDSMAVVCATADEARDVADAVRSLNPAALLLIDGGYFAAAREHGKKFVFDTETSKPTEVVVYISFDDFNAKARERKLKRAENALKKMEVAIYSTSEYRKEELDAVRDVECSSSTPTKEADTIVAVCDGAHVPGSHLREFFAEVVTLAEKHHVDLPVKVDLLSDIVTVRTTLQLKKVSDKQKVFKLVSGFAALVHKLGGSTAGGQAEGRLGAFASYAQMDDAVVALNESIRAIFDPYGTLNPGVKQKTDIKALAKLLKS